MTRKYQPSNGTEGMGFIENHCEQCIHEQFLHTQNEDDVKCDILSRTMIFNVNDKEYPKEWIWNSEDCPTCTKWKKWDWGFDDDDNPGGNKPPEPVPDNQLFLPFIANEIVGKEQ